MLKVANSVISASQIATPITLPGDVTLSTGNLVIGTSGKGIDFSATPGTGTSELFADYEEGTWTPSVGGTATYTARSGIYTKIGNQVTVSCDITINLIGTGSASSLSGLPFTSKASQYQSGSVFYFTGLAASLLYIGVATDPNSTLVAFSYTNTAGTAVTGFAPGLFGNNARIIFSITYLT